MMEGALREAFIDIWSEPITDTEEEIILSAIKRGDKDAMAKWLYHCLKIMRAQREKGL